MLKNYSSNLLTKEGRCFIVAEVSANHGKSFSRAAALVKKAKECGADAIKFQTYTPDTLTIDVDNKYFRIKHPKWGGQTLYDLYKQAYTPWSWFKKLKALADDLGIVFFSTAFDESSVDFLEKINVPFHKIASFELVDLPLIRYAAATKKPLILSTGMATVSEIKEAVAAARQGGAKQVILLKCVSSYPAKPEDMNLRTIPDMKKMFNCPVGLSDHTMGIAISVSAVPFGVQMIEKHITLSRKIKTPDSFFSIEPDELKDLVSNVRIAEKAMGGVRYGFTDEEKKGRFFRRSLFAVKDIAKGQKFTTENIKSIRPADGLKPKYLDVILGKKARGNIKKGTPLKLNMAA
ncbi:MAG: pseudaminic acid synthase [Candidatus Omnitrophica bacterium CG_4_8_14_3_um_filter_43_15]|nr:MAG: pseudaminic acid synthase [Candidatus Omnitrophica bacterium CG1_02_43_210]PIV39592.1 MAG: pseudaminic acid synthase [Candidatus Omnitrophica bacterium CG02_land_8_20_14_3_00__42_8]PIW80833.1 MAG: pseudaminic acid synthase [Candidatus Omnitrophica bacterium CG_4_8_14_3_um_filter_43_15]